MADCCEPRRGRRILWVLGVALVLVAVVVMTGAAPAAQEAPLDARAFSARLGALPRDARSERVALCAQAFAAGLVEPPLLELDRVLEAEPDQPEALALLARDDLPFAVPTWDPFAADRDGLRAALLAFGGATPRPVQERVVGQLDRMHGGQRDRLREQVVEALSGPAPGQRAFATLVLRRLFPGEAHDDLVRRALLDRLPAVRTGAARALAAGGDPERAEPFVQALQSDQALLRTRAADALGLLGVAAAVEPLALGLMTPRGAGSGGASVRGHVFVGRQVAYLADVDTEIATQAAVSDPQVGVVREGATLDVRVHGVGGGTVSGAVSAEHAALRSALARLTGARVADTDAAWRRWWKRAGPAWLVEHGVRPAADGPGEG